MSDFEIDVACSDGVQGPVDALLAELPRVLAAVPLGDAELSILLTDDATIHGLNQQWRNKDAPTDVLSFPQQEAPVQGGVLGDLVVSMDTCARQAAERGHDLETELRVLLVHGLCHLLGHDHHDPEESREMAADEARLLAVWLPGSDVAGLIDRVGADAAE